MECVDTTRNESEKLNQNLLEKVDEGIAQASKALMILLLCYVTIICLKMHTMNIKLKIISNTNEPLVYDENIKSNSKLVEMQDMHECLREEDVTILELLQQFNHNKNLPKIRNKQRK